MNHVGGDSSTMCDSEYFTKFRQKIKNGLIVDQDLNDYAARFGKNKAAAKANLALITEEYKGKRISAAEYITLNFVTKAALGIVRTPDIKAARKVWGGNLNGEDVQAVIALNNNLEKIWPTEIDYCASIRAEDAVYVRRFCKKVKNWVISDSDLQEYAKRVGKNIVAIRANLALVTLELKQGRISSSEFVVLNFVIKAALGIIGSADIKAVRRAWGGELTGEDIQAVLEANIGCPKTFAVCEHPLSGSDNQEYFSAFLQKVKNRNISDSDMIEYASRFGKDQSALKAGVNLVSAAYKNGRISASEYAALNLFAKAALGNIAATDIRAARRAWGGKLTGEDIKAVLAENSKLEKMAADENENGISNMENDDYFRGFIKKASRGVISDSDLKEYALRYDKDKTLAQANLAAIGLNYKKHDISAFEYIVLNIVMKAALGTVTTADIKAARKAWGGRLTDEDVQAVLAVNSGKKPETLPAEGVNAKISAESTVKVKVKKQTGTKAAKHSTYDLNDNEYFAAFQQKVIDNSVADSDLKEYAARFGKDTDAIKANFRIFTAQYKNKLISAQKYAELNFMAKAALGILTNVDLQAVRGVWCGDLTDEDVQAVFDGNNESRVEPAACIEAPVIKTSVNEQKNCSVSNESEDAGNLSDNEYFTVFQQRVIDGSINDKDMQEYARRFGKDLDTIKKNLKLFTRQYRNCLISGVKYAELNFMAKAALGTATEIDIKAAQKAWGGGLTFLDVQAILTQK